MTMKILLLASFLWTFVVAVPFRFSINHRSVECMWERLKKGDSATMSALILEGDQLKATLVLEGPFAESELETTMELVEAEHKFVVDKRRWTKHTIYIETVDFEHIQEQEEDEEEEEEEQYEDDDDDRPIADNEDAEAAKIRVQERRKRAQQTRRRIQQARRRRAQLIEEKNKRNAAKVRKEGAPHQKTIFAQTDGWYRGCLKADYNRVVMEIEFRTTIELDGIDAETNHVYTYEKYQERQDEKVMDADKPENEPLIKTEDFTTTRNLMRELRRSLNQISALQQTSKNRLKNHAVVGEHAQKKMTQNSILVTILFIATTAFQVYTITKWFNTGNASLLAR